MVCGSQNGPLAAAMFVFERMSGRRTPERLRKKYEE
jgi:hypothetical protein